jgi:hypothetical protein
MSPELETLDQLLSGPLPVVVLRRLYDSDEHFVRGIAAMLHVGEVRLLENGTNVPSFRWQSVLEPSEREGRTEKLELEITDAGLRRIR